MSVLLGGEGKNELGGWAGHAVDQRDDDDGVIKALLRKAGDKPFHVVGALRWRNIPKLRAHGPSPREAQNVLGLVHEASRAQADVVAFVRDADRPRKTDERGAVIDAAIETAAAAFPNVRIVGGVAVPVLEGWLLAALGTHGTEDLSKVAAQTRLDARAVRTTSDMVETIDALEVDRLPPDAVSLRCWCATAHRQLRGER